MPACGRPTAACGRLKLAGGRSIHAQGPPAFCFAGVVLSSAVVWLVITAGVVECVAIGMAMHMAIVRRMVFVMGMVFVVGMVFVIAWSF